MTEQEQIEENVGEEVVTEQVTEDVSEETPEREWSEDVEVEARAFGWKPVEEWQGAVPAGFIDDPREFMRRTEKFGPFRKLREKLDKQDDHIRRIEAVAAKQVERAHKQAEEEYNRKLSHLNEEKRKAAREGDLERYDQIAATEARLEKPKVEAPAEEAPQDPITEDIRQNHAWLNDPYLRKQAAQLVDVGFEKGDIPTNADPTAQVQYAEKQLQTYFPHLFQKEKPKPSPVEGGSLAGTKRSGFGSLPQDAKEAFGRLVKQGVFKDNDEDRKFYHDEYSNG